MPRPKRHRVLTAAPAHSAVAIDEWKAGIEDFLEWANRARTGETSLPAAVQANEALTAFSEGHFDGRFIGLSLWAVAAGKNILALVRDGHWHLVRCRWCDRWFLAKDQRRINGLSCWRVACVRATKTHLRATERQGQQELDRGAVRRAARR